MENGSSMVYYRLNGYNPAIGYAPLNNSTASLPTAPPPLGGLPPSVNGLAPVNGLGTVNGLAHSAPGGGGLLPAPGTGSGVLPAPNASTLLQKWVIPHLSASQINYLFKNRMDKKKVQRPVTCETCGITLNSDQQAQQHFVGKAHLKMLRKLGKPVPEEFQAKIAARTGKRRYTCTCKDHDHSVAEKDDSFSLDNSENDCPPVNGEAPPTAPNSSTQSESLNGPTLIDPGSVSTNSDLKCSQSESSNSNDPSAPNSEATPTDPDAPPAKRKKFFQRRRWRHRRCELCDCGKFPDREKEVKDEDASQKPDSTGENKGCEDSKNADGAEKSVSPYADQDEALLKDEQGKLGDHSPDTSDKKSDQSKSMSSPSNHVISSTSANRLSADSKSDYSAKVDFRDVDSREKCYKDLSEFEARANALQSDTTVASQKSATSSPTQNNCRYGDVTSENNYGANNSGDRSTGINFRASYLAKSGALNGRLGKRPYYTSEEGNSTTISVSDMDNSGSDRIGLQQGEAHKAPSPSVPTSKSHVVDLSSTGSSGLVSRSGVIVSKGSPVKSSAAFPSNSTTAMQAFAANKSFLAASVYRSTLPGALPSPSIHGNTRGAIGAPPLATSSLAASGRINGEKLGNGTKRISPQRSSARSSLQPYSQSHDSLFAVTNGCHFNGVLPTTPLSNPTISLPASFSSSLYYSTYSSTSDLSPLNNTSAVLSPLLAPQSYLPASPVTPSLVIPDQGYTVMPPLDFNSTQGYPYGGLGASTLVPCSYGNSTAVTSPSGFQSIQSGLSAVSTGYLRVNASSMAHDGSLNSNNCNNIGLDCDESADAEAFYRDFTADVSRKTESLAQARRTLFKKRAVYAQTVQLAVILARRIKRKSRLYALRNRLKVSGKPLNVTKTQCVFSCNGNVCVSTSDSLPEATSPPGVTLQPGPSHDPLGIQAGAGVGGVGQATTYGEFKQRRLLELQAKAQIREEAALGVTDPVQKAILANAQGKLPLKRKTEALPCTVCGDVLLGESQYQAHVAGKKHAKRLRHAGKAHMTFQIPADAAPLTSELIVQEGAFFRCLSCQTSLNSSQQVTMHLNGQGHKKKSESWSGKSPQNTDSGPSLPRTVTSPTPAALQQEPTGSHPVAVETSGTAIATPCDAKATSDPQPCWQAGEVNGNRSGWMYCRICDVSVLNSTKLQLHTTSDFHKNMHKQAKD